MAPPNINDWAKALAESLATGIDKVPDGWKTTHEIAEMLDLSRGRTAERIRVLIANRQAISKNFRIKTGQIVRPVPHYRLL